MRKSSKLLLSVLKRLYKVQMVDILFNVLSLKLLPADYKKSDTLYLDDETSYVMMTEVESSFKENCRGICTFFCKYKIITIQRSVHNVP
jgi:hypothetical protein